METARRKGRQMIKKTGEDRGFSLIELLVSMAISSVLLLTLYQVFSVNTKVMKIENDKSFMDRYMRIALNAMVEELRVAGYNNGNPGSRHINAITRVQLDTNNNAMEITFKYDQDNDEIIQDEEIVTFRLDNNIDDPTSYRDADHRRLMRGTGGNPPCCFRSIALNINTLIFTFFDSSGGTIVSTMINDAGEQTTRDTIRAVQVSITGGTEKRDIRTGSYLTHTLFTYLVPRNLSL